jgi:hypothetical protein
MVFDCGDGYNQVDVVRGEASISLYKSLSEELGVEVKKVLVKTHRGQAVVVDIKNYTHVE